MSKDSQSNALSFAISELISAIDAYPSSPKLGLSHFKQAFTLIMPPLFSANGRHSIVCDRMMLCSNAIHIVLQKQPNYDQVLRLALYEVIDALQQYFLAQQIGDHYVELVLPLFASDRSCWKTLEQASNITLAASVSEYEGRCKENKPNDVAVIMTELSSVGAVSFHLDEMTTDIASGYFRLSTIQPLTWLKMRFPNLLWNVPLSPQAEGGLSLLSLSFPSVFLSEALPRQKRYQLLDEMTQSIATHYYAHFRQCIASDVLNDVIQYADRLISISAEPALIDISFNESVCPVRVNGHYFAVSSFVYESTLSLSRPEDRSQCVHLGQDVLSSLLYVINTGERLLAFDQADCIGRFTVYESQIQQEPESGAWVCCLENGLRASLVLSSGLFDLGNNVLRLDSGASLDLLVVNQVGKLFAFAMKNLCQAEGICAFSSYQGKWVKNIWLTYQGESYVEPWAETVEYISFSGAIRNTVLDAVTSAVPNSYGFYHVAFNHVSLWVDASLVLDLVPYVSSVIAYSAGSGENEREDVMLYGVEYFNRFISLVDNVSPRFALLINDHGSLAFLSEAFLWHKKVPENAKDSGFDCLQIDCIDNRINILGSSNGNEDNFVINKKNISVFIDYLWPHHPLEKCEKL